MFTEIHHIGYWVDYLEPAIAHYERAFGGKVVSRSRSTSLTSHPGVGANIAFVQSGSTLVELMQPDDLAVMGNQRGQALAHVAYRVDDMDQAVAALRERGVEFLEGHPMTNPQGWRIAYFKDSSNLGSTAHLIQV